MSRSEGVAAGTSLPLGPSELDFVVGAEEVVDDDARRFSQDVTPVFGVGEGGYAAVFR